MEHNIQDETKHGMKIKKKQNKNYSDRRRKSKYEPRKRRVHNEE